MIGVIRSESKRRSALLRDEDPDFAYDQWLFTDEPFVNELCLVLVVAIRHQVERELIRLAARVTRDGKDIDGKEYQQNVQKERERLRKADGWKNLSVTLSLTSSPEWESSIETLRLLANSYKHEPWEKPEAALLAHVKADVSLNYASLSESHLLRERVAECIGLPNDASYCDIAEEFLARAAKFVEDVQNTNAAKLSHVIWPPASLLPEDAES